MTTDQTQPDEAKPDKTPKTPETPPSQPVIMNNIAIGDGRAWNILITLLISGGLTVFAWRLSLSGFKEMAASGVTIFIVTLIGYMFKAGILRLPAAPTDDDLAFTKSTLRRIYDEIQMAIVKSSMLKLVIFALIYSAGFMLLRTAVSVGIGMLTSWWIALGVGLIVGGLVIAQDQILAWLRANMIKKGAK